MKIIGKTKNDYILTANDSELRMLEEGSYIPKHYQIGMKIDIGAIYSEIKDLKNVDIKLKIVRKKLQEIINNFLNLNF